MLELDLRKGEGGPDFVVFRRDQVQQEAPPAAPEGGADHTVAFTVTRLNGTGRTATVEADLDASSTAAQGSDFTGPSFPVTVRFEPGETEKSVEVTVLGPLGLTALTLLLALAGWIAMRRWAP